MDHISQSDREILRSIASRKREYAASANNARILAKWRAQAEGRRESPIVRLLFSNFPNEVVNNRMRCEGDLARSIERSLLTALVGYELFGDDTPMSDQFEIPLRMGVSPYGTAPNLKHVPNSVGFHIEPMTDDIESDFHIFEGGSFFVDKKGTEEFRDAANEVFGDILPAKIVMNNLVGGMTNPLVMLINMETLYISMYDAPETLHKIMDMACRVYENFYDYLEREQLILPNNDFAPISQESFAFTDELPAVLPADRPLKTTDIWGFLESQETTACSPEAYGEFVYPYQDRLARRFGLLSYGCCERVDTLWEDYISKWKHLRKLSVSPFSDMHVVGEQLRGSRVVFYSKPRAEHVTNRGPLDEDLIRNYFREVAEAASGCLFEVAQREVGTIYGDIERGRRYVQLARESIDRYWKP